MPSVQFVCPHCEKHSEVQVASVTRSRACPHCGYMVLLQVGGADKSRRRALLVTPSKDEPLPVGKEAHEPGKPAYMPMPLEGDAFDRMCADPEIQVIRKQLMTGIAVLGLLIAAAIVWHFVKDSEVINPPPGALPPVAIAPTSPSPFIPSRSPSVAAAAPLPGTLGAGAVIAPPTPGGLNFVTTSGTVRGATASPVTAGKQDKTEQARKVLTAFLGADTVDALLPTVAYRPLVEEQLRAYYAGHPLVALRATEIVAIEDPLSPPDSTVLQLTLSSGRQVRAYVLAPDERHLGVDWPSFVALSDMEWNQFLASRPGTPAQFRMLAETGDWYANGFADANKLFCLKLINPTDPRAEPFFAYTERSGVLGQQVESLMRGRSGPVPLTLRLKFRPNNEAENQGVLDSLVSSSWVILPDASTTAQVRN